MLFCFTLSMPVNRSWNGKWSGEGRGYYIVKSINGKKAIEKLKSAGNYHQFVFSDGWVTAISVEEVVPVVAGKRRKASVGFAGYDWMVDDIIHHGRIRTLDEKYPKKETV